MEWTEKNSYWEYIYYHGKECPDCEFVTCFFRTGSLICCFSVSFSLSLGVYYISLLLNAYLCVSMFLCISLFIFVHLCSSSSLFVSVRFFLPLFAFL